MSKERDAERLKQLEKRIEQARGPQSPGKAHQDEHYSQAHTAWRMVIELVVGLLIGFGIGFGLDALFGTQPLFMVLFIALGFAAGVRTMMRTAQEVQAQHLAETAKQNKPPSGRDE